jgi:NADPH:quinone reductase-like Zn-dependent oxidoreductase
MRAVRLHHPGTLDDLVVEDVPQPSLAPGVALVRVHAAALTKDELEWPVDRLPAIPSYELSGVVEALAGDASGISVGDAVYALASFDRDGAAAEFAAVLVDLLAPRPRTLGDVESAAVPLAGVSAWQGLIEHGALESGQRVLIHGATGGVGHLATQLARQRGAYVVATASPARADRARELGAHEVLDPASFEDGLEPVDLVFDTAGGDLIARSAAAVRPGGRLVSVAEEPPADLGIDARYFIVEPNRAHLTELTRLIDEGHLKPAVDSVFGLDDARAAFERTAARGKTGKVVLQIA